MGLPRISYNSKNVDLPEDVSVMPWQLQQQGTQNRSVSGIGVETLSHRIDVVVSAAWDMLVASGVADTERKRQLRQLAQWIQAGSAFTFARDRDKTVNTTISADAAAGASSVVVASATGITIGDEYVLRDSLRAETVKVSNISGTTITLAETLNFDFAAGARFRYAEYWPARAVPGTLVVRDVPPVQFSVSLDFYEDVSGL